MDIISKTHKLFSELLNNPRVLTNPEEFLGPNYREVLNFWLILEELSEDQLRVVNECYLGFKRENFSEWDRSTDLTIEASKEVVGENYDIAVDCATWNITNSGACWAARELIGMHLILEQQKPLTFFEMFFEAL